MNVRAASVAILIVAIGVSDLNSSPRPGPGQPLLDPKSNGEMTMPVRGDIAEAAEALRDLGTGLKLKLLQSKTGAVPKDQAAVVIEQGKKVAAEIGAQYADSALVQTMVGKAMLEAGDLEAAATFANRARELAPEDPFPMAISGVIAYDQGNYPAADELAHAILKQNPKHGGAFSLHMLSHGRPPSSGGGLEGVTVEGDARLHDSVLTESAPPMLKDILRNDPKIREVEDKINRRKRANSLLGNFVGQVGMADHDLTIDRTTKALEHDPNHPDAYMQRAMARTAKGELELAEKDATKAIHNWGVQASTKNIQNLATAYSLRARLNIEMGRVVQGFDDAVQALKLNPNSANAYKQRGLAAQKLGRPAEEVLADFKRAAEIDPQNFSKLYESALADYKGQQQKERHTKERKDREGSWFGQLHNRIEDVMGGEVPKESVMVALGGASVLAVGLLAFLWSLWRDRSGRH